MSAATEDVNELIGGIPLTPSAPVTFDPPYQEEQLRSYKVTAVHVVALPPLRSKADKNQWLFFFQVEGAQGHDAVQVDLTKTGRRSTKCNIRCHKRFSLSMGPDGFFSGVSKGGKMLVLPGYTVDTLLGKMEVVGLLHYMYLSAIGKFLSLILTSWV